MKRKLVCIFFMLAGAATLVGTILLSLRRPENADASPVLTLIIISVATIAVAEWYMNREPYTSQVCGRGKIILWTFRIVNILAILVCLAFVVTLWVLTSYYTVFMQNVLPLMLLATVGITAAALSVKERPPIIGRYIAMAATALLISAALGFIYLSYMPKYTQKDSTSYLRSDKECLQKDVYIPGGDNGVVGRFFSGSDPFFDQFFGVNPFFTPLYEYHCDSFSYDENGLRDAKGYIIINPATGAYEYLRTQDQDMVFSPGEWPEFNYNFIYDRDGKHNAVLNLFFRELDDSDWAKFDACSMLIVSSDEWDAKVKDMMYPHNFPEDEARAFLGSIGEEALKTKLMEQVNEHSGFKDKMIEMYFFGIDLATYQNGEIVLKL